VFLGIGGFVDGWLGKGAANDVSSLAQVPHNDDVKCRIR
jgi:hypothetical protein